MPTVPAIPRSTQPRSPRPHGDACTLVLIGATGDLARRKLIGAIYDLARKYLVADGLTLLGVDRDAHTDEEFRKIAREALESSDEVKHIPPAEKDAAWAKLADRIFYVGGDVTDAQTYARIKTRLEELESASPGVEANRLFYLAVPPVIFEPIVKGLSASGLAPRTPHAETRPWRRLVIEKPFGHSLATARALNHLVLEHFGEHQVFRIDHYLGKETVQNILVFRASNAIFEPVWNRQHIAHVQITAAETVGVEQRGRYYERAGVVRDMFQNHLLQLLALTAMELPTTLEANAVRDEKVKVLRALRPLVDAEGNTRAVRAQYAAGAHGGKDLPGYRQEPNVEPTSATPTYAAMRVLIDNGRWRGVPFYLRSGKRLPKRTTEIAVQFRVPPYLMEGLCGPTTGLPVEPNLLVLRVQPDDGITLRFDAKIPGAALQLTPEIEVSSVDMTFNYADAFGAEVYPAYETLLLDIMLGDATLFTRSDEVDAGWQITDPLLEAWEARGDDGLEHYPVGSWGPAGADELLAEDGFRWHKA